MFIPEAYGGAPLSYAAYLACVREISQGVRLDRHHLGDQLPRDEAADRLRHRGAEAAPAAAHRAKAGSARSRSPSRGAGSDATGMRTRFRPEGDHDRRDRRQDVHHQRRRGRPLSAVRQVERDRRRQQSDLGAGRGEGHAGPRASCALEDKMGMRASSTATLAFDNCRVPRANLLGKPGDGLKILLRLAQQVAPERRGARAGHRARRVRGCGRLHQRAPAVGPAHRRVPGHPVHARRHGDRPRDVRELAVARRAAGRRGRARTSASRRRC